MTVASGLMSMASAVASSVALCVASVTWLVRGGARHGLMVRSGAVAASLVMTVAVVPTVMPMVMAVTRRLRSLATMAMMVVRLDCGAYVA